MNKKTISDCLPLAYEALKESKIVKDGVIDKAYRGQIASFGTAVTMGSLLPAIAFFSDQGGSAVERPRLMDAVLRVLKEHYTEQGISESTLYAYASRRKSEGKENECKEDIINATIAVKLAMNLYVLKKDDAKDKK